MTPLEGVFEHRDRFVDCGKWIESFPNVRIGLEQVSRVAISTSTVRTISFTRTLDASQTRSCCANMGLPSSTQTPNDFESLFAEEIRSIFVKYQSENIGDDEL